MGWGQSIVVCVITMICQCSALFILCPTNNNSSSITSNRIPKLEKNKQTTVDPLLPSKQRNKKWVNLHMVSPRVHTSGLEWSSMKTVGMHTMRTSRSATLKLIRNTLVELVHSSRVLHTTKGTSRLPVTPNSRMHTHDMVATVRSV